MDIAQETFTVDPFQKLDEEPLGKSNSVVWKVARESDGMVYARKEFPAPRREDKYQIEKIKKEIRNMAKIKHHHTVELRGTHYIENTQIIGLLLLPVADMNLTEFFGRLDREQYDEPESLEARKTMCQWPPCLFQAMDFLHDSGLRHKDIKPSNILIKGDSVYIADFGISNNFRDATTSKTEGEPGANTKRYIAPEIYNELPRGRAADIWALGCTVLEICTVASGENSIGDLTKHLKQGQKHPPTSFCRSPYLVFDWIFMLLACPGQDDWCNRRIQKMLQLAFLMLDPNPKTRISARQLVDLLNEGQSNDFHSVGKLACEECKRMSHVPLHNLPLHSVFKKTENGGTYIPSRKQLSRETHDLWEEVKRRWLESHIWWDFAA
ncbi:kinase-like protein [Rostrohypoxylon terebratum]|nr:kinase-like protein [Rostrohypoxylon terebratum]